jgi:hypothetical protein
MLEKNRMDKNHLDSTLSEKISCILLLKLTEALIDLPLSLSGM